MGRRNRRGRAVHGVLLLDKPAGGSSNHALQRVKRLFDARKAGHAGSLDPLATGMLPICLGEATKLAAHLIEADKGYETTLRLGVTTDSADADGEVLERRPVPAGLDADAFVAVCAAFEGPQLQVPPMVSAIKVDGQRLYRLARAGVTVEREPRPITIHALEVIAFDGETARLAVRCSKGTYIRSLVADIGERLGCGAHVTALRRTFVAPFDRSRFPLPGATDQPESDRAGDAPPPMFTLGALERIVAEAGAPEAARAALDRLLLPPDAGLDHLPEVTLGTAGAARFRSGQDAPFDALRPGLPVESVVACAGQVASLPGPWRVRETSGRLLGLGMPTSDGRSVAPSRVLQWD